MTDRSKDASEQLSALLEATRSARNGGAIDPLIAHFPYARYLGITAEPGAEAPRFHLPFNDALVGNASLPAIHGGAIAAFMETAALLTVLIAEQQRRVPKPIDFSLDYLRSARARDCHAECSIIRHGRRVVMAQVRCWQTDIERPVSVARTHFLIDSMGSDEVPTPPRSSEASSD